MTDAISAAAVLAAAVVAMVVLPHAGAGTEPEGQPGHEPDGVVAGSAGAEKVLGAAASVPGTRRSRA